MSTQSIPCDYCGKDAPLLTGVDLYPHRRDLADKLFYVCRPCKAWVGTHDGTAEPLGRLANAELRLWKSRAHAAFDPLWRAKMKRGNLRKGHARGLAYEWLAAELGIEPEKCHIGMFDTVNCQRVVELCEPYSKKFGDAA